MVEWDGLENRCTGNRTVGSNPTLSAKTLLFFKRFMELRLFGGFQHKVYSPLDLQTDCKRDRAELFSSVAESISGIAPSADIPIEVDQLWRPRFVCD